MQEFVQDPSSPTVGIWVELQDLQAPLKVTNPNLFVIVN